VERDIFFIATKSYNKGILRIFYCACAKRPYFRFRFEDVFSYFFIGKAKSPPYLYFRFIWPTDLESVPRVEPPMIISTKFKVDTTIHRSVVGDLVTFTFDLLTLDNGQTWQVMWSTPPPNLKILRLSVLDL